MVGYERLEYKYEVKGWQSWAKIEKLMVEVIMMVSDEH